MSKNVYTVTFTFDELEWILNQHRVFIWRPKARAKLKRDLELHIEKLSPPKENPKRAKKDEDG